MSKIIACRIEHCLGCRSCEMACALAHSESKDLRGAVKEHPLPQRRVTVETAGGHGLPLQCRHCEDGLCQLVCPTGAISRDEKSGIVSVDEDLCIGCKLCTLMCPLGVLKIGDRNRATIKCDQCIDRQADGLEPACVAACPTHALQFVEREGVAQEERQLTAVSVVAALTGGGEAEKEIAEKSRRPKAAKVKGAESRRVVVIGSNAAGATAAIRAAQSGAKVTLITADAVSYRRPAIPSLIGGQIDDIADARIYAPETFRKYGIAVRAPVTAIGIDTKKKTITVKREGGKSEEVAYDAAVLATGGIVARPKIPGADKTGVCTFTTAEAACEIVRLTETAHSAVVIGASFVALEVAEALLKKGLTVYFNVRSRVLRRIVEPDISDFLQQRFEARGLRMLTGEAVSEIGGTEAVEYVVHKGKKIPAELVILGTGVRPNVELARAAGIKLGDSGAIAVDHRMQTSTPDVYAAGDCAEAPDLTTGRFVYSAVGSIGALAGAIAGVNAAGCDQKTDGFLRAQADQILGLQIYSIGHTSTTAKGVGLQIKVHDLPSPPGVDRSRDEVKAKLLTDAEDRIVGAQAVAYHHGSQYAWQLYKAVLLGERREEFLAHWTAPRQNAARLVEEIGFGEIAVQTAEEN
ncbi:MAG TPA: FAD-dependent oxidoreductase [Phycisphaerae bacterium]|nr:FAD-dependent oxidoreductase [Phycisphaerae bacterium]HUS44515.1 FAD-dependent oxidoreductase [Phycisphaerae bacterium]